VRGWLTFDLLPAETRNAMWPRSARAAEAAGRDPLQLRQAIRVNGEPGETRPALVTEARRSRDERGGVCVRVVGMPSPSLSIDAVEADVTDALLALSRVFVGLAARTLAQLDEDVTLPQYRVLVLLVSHGPQRVVDLSQELQVTSSTATRMCNRLVRKGLAERQERADDRRASWIGLTGAGRELVDEVMRLRREAIAELVREVAITRPVAFAGVVHAFVEASGEISASEWRAVTGSQKYVHG
jgi:DNA-binding MarR family transcriptional regulator